MPQTKQKIDDSRNGIKEVYHTKIDYTTFSRGAPRFKLAERYAVDNKLVSAAGDNPLPKV